MNNNTLILIVEMDVIGKILDKKSQFAVGTAVGLFLAGSTLSAQAADFGGDCCADLEERVAVLEATTARKGNKKVSLVISGQVNQALMIWDDGVNSDAYVVTNTNSATRFRFKGSAKINHDVSAGYYIEIGVEQDRSAFGLNANNDDSVAFYIRQSNMYLQSKRLGKLTWGQQSPVTDDMAFYGSVAGIAGHFQPDWHYGFSFALNNAAGAPVTTIGGLAGAANGTLYWDGTTRQSTIRYDTPSIAGFTLSAAWGENDFWDVGIRYSGDFNGVKIKAAVGYFEFDEANGVLAARGATEEKSFVASLGLLHSPTGLFVHGAYRSFEYDGAAGVVGLPDAEGYHIQAGIKRRFNELGYTAIWGGYTQVDDGYIRTAIGTIANGSDTEISRISVGLTQWIEAAAMELYVVYDHTEAEINNVDLQDFDTVTIGGRILF